MRFHVVGAGAIGGFTGAYLARNGEDVTFVDIVPEHVQAMKERGMLVDGVEEFRVHAPASLPQDLEGPLDVVLLAVKSQHTEQALEGIMHALGPDSLVVSLQNGLNPDKIAARIGTERTAGAFINFAADYIEPGHIEYGGRGDYFLGRLDGPPDERLREIAGKFDKIMNTVLTDNIMGYLWGKECYGSMLTGTALVDASVFDVLAVPENREVLTVTLREAIAVADALGITLEPFGVFEPSLFRGPGDQAAIDAFYDRVSARFRGWVKQHTGIWRDLKVRKRKTEVEWLTGEVVRRGEALGLALPVNRRMMAMIAEIENGQRPMAWENLIELHSLIGKTA